MGETDRRRKCTKWSKIYEKSGKNRGCGRWWIERKIRKKKGHYPFLQ